MKILFIGIVICIIIFAILLYMTFTRVVKNTSKIKEAVFKAETNDLIILKDYENKEISKKIKINTK